MQRDLNRLSAQCHDLLIVGGGIHGACAAWEAALRGLSVALIERDDLGQATSSNSQKIVHGGLRYLQSLDLKRMRESIRERAILLRIAPHLVHPVPFLMPTYGHGLRSKPVMAAAFFLNDLISHDRNHNLDDLSQQIPRCQVVSRQECLRLAPGIHEQGLTGGALWHDGQMYNSERLTLSFLLSAYRVGATVANYVKAVSLLRDVDRVSGVVAEDVVTGRRFEIRARTVLNTAGPWAMQLAGSPTRNDHEQRIAYLKAMNLVTRPLTNGIALGVGNNGPRRNGPGLFFITPWRDRSVIGTVYSLYQGDPDQCQVSEEEIQRFLDEINSIYPPAQLCREEVSFAHLGLLPATSVNAAEQRVQLETRYRLINHQRRDGIDGLVSVVGVKFTTARDVAERAVNLVCGKLNRGIPRRVRSREEPLVGGRIERFEEFLKCEIAKQPHGLQASIIRHLIFSYGSSYGEVLKWVDEDPGYGGTVDGSSEVIKAEIIHAVRKEMAVKLVDVIFRRTDLGTRGYPGEACLYTCTAIMARECGWDAQRRTEEIEDVRAVFARKRIAIGALPLPKVQEPRTLALRETYSRGLMLLR